MFPVLLLSLQAHLRKGYGGAFRSIRAKEKGHLPEAPEHPYRELKEFCKKIVGLEL